MHVTLADVWRAARARQVPFSAESAGYVVLCVIEELSVFPQLFSANEVELAEDGSLRLSRGPSASLIEAERCARALLGNLLAVSSSPGPALSRVASRTPDDGGRLDRRGDGSAGLAALGAELENALIPLNRSAARRALCRLARETTRALEAGLNATQPAPPAPISNAPKSGVSLPAPGSAPVQAERAAPAETRGAMPTPNRGAANQLARDAVTDRDRGPGPTAAFQRSSTESPPQTPRLGTWIDSTDDDLPDDITQRLPNVQTTVPVASAPFTATRVPSRHLDPESAADPLERGNLPRGEQTPFWGVPAVHLSPRAVGTETASQSRAASPSLGAIRDEPQFGLESRSEPRAASSVQPLSPEEEDELEIEILPEPLELSPCRVPPVQAMSHECSAEPSPDSLDVTPVAHHKLVEALHACTTYTGQGAQRSDVKELIADFQVRADWTEDELSRELKGLAQVELTPAGADAGPRAKSTRR